MQVHSGSPVVLCCVAIRSSPLHIKGSPEVTFMVKLGCHIDCKRHTMSSMWLEHTMCGTAVSLNVGKDICSLSLKMPVVTFPEKYKKSD